MSHSPAFAYKSPNRIPSIVPSRLSSHGAGAVVNVKAQALLNGAKCVREKFGEDALEQVLAACSPRVRERCATAIAINWHPQSELCEFLTVADRVLGRGDGKLSEEIGATGARAN